MSDKKNNQSLVTRAAKRKGPRFSVVKSRHDNTEFLRDNYMDRQMMLHSLTVSEYLMLSDFLRLANQSAKTKE